MVVTGTSREKKHAEFVLRAQVTREQPVTSLPKKPPWIAALEIEHCVSVTEFGGCR